MKKVVKKNKKKKKCTLDFREGGGWRELDFETEANRDWGVHLRGFHSLAGQVTTVQENNFLPWLV